MILLKRCFRVATLDEGRVLEDADILVRGDRIERVGAGLEAPGGLASEDGVEVLDCSRHVVVPGFVNTHHHFYQTLTRAVPEVQNAPLFAWLRALYEIWKNIDADAVRVSSRLAMAELLLTGCTCSTDHHYLYPAGFRGDLMGLQFEAAEELGLRFAPCRGSMSLGRRDGGLPPDSVVQDEGEILEDSRRVIERWHDPDPLARRKVLLAPCSPFSVSRELMERTAGLARAHGVRLHTHLAETRDEERFCLQKYGRRPLALMEEWGFVGRDVSFAHGVHFDDAELDLLARTGTSVAHCPSSNMRLGSGIARVREMLDRGVNVALAVDGSASNDSSDFLGEMRAALLLGRVLGGAGALTVAEVYRMATENGARLLGFSGLGRIREGWGADLAVFDVGGPEYAGALADPPAALILAGIGHRTAHTIVAGRLAVRHGRLTGCDEEALAREGRRASERLLGGR